MDVIFKVTKWDENPIDETRKDFPINIAHVEYEISGELKGKAIVEYLLYYLESSLDDGHMATAKISGFLYFDGTYNGKKGTFTAIEQGVFDKGILNSPGTIIKATGDFVSLKGSYNYKFVGQTGNMILDFKKYRSNYKREAGESSLLLFARHNLVVESFKKASNVSRLCVVI